MSGSGPIDLSRCSWCGRKGTLTSLSMGNRCVHEDDCWDARDEMLARAAAVTDNDLSATAATPESAEVGPEGA